MATAKTQRPTTNFAGTDGTAIGEIIIERREVIARAPVYEGYGQHPVEFGLLAAGEYLAEHPGDATLEFVWEADRYTVARAALRPVE